jgi:hypothetical protein
MMDLDFIPIPLPDVEYNNEDTVQTVTTGVQAHVMRHYLFAISRAAVLEAPPGPSDISSGCVYLGA